MRVLILGGSTEASLLAKALARDHHYEPILSLAGRTRSPKAQPVQTRIGGFGGVSGLCDYLRSERIDRIVDATHPFAAQMSRNAIEASARTGVSLFAVERPPWKKTDADRWICVPDMASAIKAIGAAPRIVFCGVGRLTLPELLAAPQHRYIVRLIDTPNEPLDLRRCKIIQARGPFTTEDDIALFRDHGVEIVLAKNSGGQASISKIEAARALGLPVVMIERPAIPPRACVATVDEALQLLSQLLALDWFAAQLAIERGV